MVSIGWYLGLAVESPYAIHVYSYRIQPVSTGKQLDIHRLSYESQLICSLALPVSRYAYHSVNTIVNSCILLYTLCVFHQYTLYETRIRIA